MTGFEKTLGTEKIRFFICFEKWVEVVDSLASHIFSSLDSLNLRWRKPKFNFVDTCRFTGLEILDLNFERDLISLQVFVFSINYIIVVAVSHEMKLLSI